MKSLFIWLETITKKLTFWDIGAVKVMALIFGFIIGLFTPKTYRKFALAATLPIFIILLPLFIYKVFVLSNEND